MRLDFTRAVFLWAAGLLGWVVLGGCVPEGPPTSGSGAGAQKAPKPVQAAPKASAQAAGGARAMLDEPFEDTFNRDELGADWNALSPAWKIRSGKLCVRGAKNHGAWLLKRLPVNVRIEFDAVAEAPDGDLKAEVFGDGTSFATGASYTNATSYLVILGGWKNKKHVLARLDEHGDDRLEIDVEENADDERARPVEVGQPYRFRVEREDGKTLRWSVNGHDYFELSDPNPLLGSGHEYLGFNNWDAPVCFDNVKVVPL